MSQTDTNSAALSVSETLTQMVQVLGFHDLASFLMASVFVIGACAFVIAGTVVIIRKRRERLAELEKIVAEIQEEAREAKIAEPAQKAPPVVKPAEKIVPEVLAKIPVPPEVKPQPPIKEEAKLPEPVKPAPTVVTPPEPKKPAPKEVKAHKAAEPSLSIKPAPEKAKPIPQVVPEVSKPIEPQAPKVEVAETKAAVEQPKPVVAEEKIDNKAALGAALKNTRGGFMEKLARIFSRNTEISDADFEEMEAVLFTADIGAKTAQKLLDVMRERARSEKAISKDFLRGVLKDEMTKILESAKPEPKDSAQAPQVLMFVGVNGAGKTTSIGKLGAQLVMSGKKVLFGAGDTFRAAAVEQLSVWGKRVGAEVVSGKENSDSAAVLFEAIEKAKNAQVDYVLCDTAGRLHTKVSLMDELKKVHRVVSKAQTGAPHQVYLVIDATMGQNALNQAREFAAATPLTGVVLSKLDGTAKGGVALGIVDELKVPIRYIGIGERVTDLKDFDAKLFVDALFEEA